MSKTTIPTGGITDGTIATGDLADGAVTAAKTTGVATDLQAIADGSNSAPSLANSGDTNTGIFFPAADKVGITTAGNLHTTFLKPTTCCCSISLNYFNFFVLKINNIFVILLIPSCFIV